MRIKEKTVYLYNPLPHITYNEVMEKSGLSAGFEPKDRIETQIGWRYGSGPEREFLVLDPGASAPLRAGDAAVAMKQLKERGIVILPLEHTEEDKDREGKAGIRRAIQFFADRGRTGISKLRRIHGWSQEELEDRKYEHWTYYFNQTIADMLQEYLRKPAPKATKTKAA